MTHTALRATEPETSETATACARPGAAISRSAPPVPDRILLASLSGQLGGMELRLADEARFLAARGAHCLVGPSPFPGRDNWLDPWLAETRGCERFEFDPPRFFEHWSWRRLNFARARWHWIRRLRRARIDLAHIFYAWTFEGGSRLWLCAAAGIPCVLSIHNSFPTATLTPWHHRLTRQGFRAVRGLYGVTQSALDHFLTTYGEFIPRDAVIRVVPNFVDVDRFQPSSERRETLRTELDIPADAFVIGSVGRLDTQKEPMQVLDVFDRLWQSGLRGYLLFCGQGPLDQAARSAADHYPWRDRVRFLGFRRDTEAVFAALDVHLLLSRQEGFGIATAEAMACGVPVVATEVPGTRDVLHGTDAGLLLDYGDTVGAAERIAALWRNQDLRLRLSAAGPRAAATRYSKAVWEAALAEFYGQVGERRGVSR
ncbi:MAG: glycosyltransferase family 4 protein [Rhodocyclaceae bacterium]|nr:glycosyltransferase family 4 protein [Rhodocyclaceae bacterium]